MAVEWWNPEMPEQRRSPYAPFNQEELHQTPVPMTPDRTTPIIAWRAWILEEDSAAPLHSVANRKPWVPYMRMTAHCICDDGKHTCGVHASESLFDVLSQFGGGQAEYLYGRVRLWGRVYAHENRVYRAEFAYPDTIAWDTRCERLLGRWIAESVARLYGVESEGIEFPTRRDPVYPAIHQLNLAVSLQASTRNLRMAQGRGSRPTGLRPARRPSIYRKILAALQGTLP